MNHKLQNAFEPIRATEEMKRNLSAFVCAEVSKRERKPRAPLRYAVACYAAIALMVCGVGSYYFYQTPVSYISVDVNPSVELGLNPLDRVVTVTAYNDDGVAVLQNLDLKNRPYTEAVELLLADKTFESYLFEDNWLSFTVVSNKEEALMDGIRQCQGYAEFDAQCRGANSDLIDAARQSGLSFGKYQAFLELSQYDKTVTPEDCQHLSMRELRDRISQYTNGDESDTFSNSNGNGYGGGGGRGRGRGRGRGWCQGRGFLGGQ